MVTFNDNGMARVTVTLEPDQVRLLDRMAKVQQSSRSAELRSIIEAARPTLESVVQAFEGFVTQQGRMDEAIRTASERELAALLPELERIQSTFLGVMARLEGAAAVADGGAKG